MSDDLALEVWKLQDRVSSLEYRSGHKVSPLLDTLTTTVEILGKKVAALDDRMALVEEQNISLRELTEALVQKLALSHAREFEEQPAPTLETSAEQKLSFMYTTTVAHFAFRALVALLRAYNGGAELRNPGDAADEWTEAQNNPFILSPHRLREITELLNQAEEALGPAFVGMLQYELGARGEYKIITGGESAEDEA